QLNSTSRIEEQLNSTLLLQFIPKSCGRTNIKNPINVLLSPFREEVSIEVARLSQRLFKQTMLSNTFKCMLLDLALRDTDLSLVPRQNRTMVNSPLIGYKVFCGLDDDERKLIADKVIIQRVTKLMERIEKEKMSSELKKNTKLLLEIMKEVKKFWLDVDLEKAESERKLAKIILEQKEIELKQKEVDIEISKAEFVINHSEAGNKGHSLLNDQKLKYIENLDNDKEIEL
ncbi:7866_t:CDS:2, partial [Racocetra fulgida]